MPRGKHQNQVFRVIEDTPSSRNAKHIQWNSWIITLHPSCGAVGRAAGGERCCGTRLPFRGGRMAHAGGTGYDNREIVMKYIHYKLSQRGYEWDAGDAGAAPPGAAPAPGILSSQPGRTPAPSRTSPPPPPAAAAGPAPSPVPPVVHLTLRQAGDDFSRRYRRDFAEMSSQLHRRPSPRGDASPRWWRSSSGTGWTGGASWPSLSSEGSCVWRASTGRCRPWWTASPCGWPSTWTGTCTPGSRTTEAG